jgi:hypothetical protein
MWAFKGPVGLPSASPIFPLPLAASGGMPAAVQGDFLTLRCRALLCRPLAPAAVRRVRRHASVWPGAVPVTASWRALGQPGHRSPPSLPDRVSQTLSTISRGRRRADGCHLIRLSGSSACSLLAEQPPLGEGYRRDGKRSARQRFRARLSANMK